MSLDVEPPSAAPAYRMVIRRPIGYHADGSLAIRPLHTTTWRAEAARARPARVPVVAPPERDQCARARGPTSRRRCCPGSMVAHLEQVHRPERGVHGGVRGRRGLPPPSRPWTPRSGRWTCSRWGITAAGAAPASPGSRRSRPPPQSSRWAESPRPSGAGHARVASGPRRRSAPDGPRGHHQRGDRWAADDHSVEGRHHEPRRALRSLSQIPGGLRADFGHHHRALHPRSGGPLPRGHGRAVESSLRHRARGQDHRRRHPPGRPGQHPGHGRAPRTCRAKSSRSSTSSPTRPSRTASSTPAGSASWARRRTKTSSRSRRSIPSASTRFSSTPSTAPPTSTSTQRSAPSSASIAG